MKTISILTTSVVILTILFSTSALAKSYSYAGKFNTGVSTKSVKLKTGATSKYKKVNLAKKLKDANENLRELYELFYNFNFEKMDELYTKLRKEAKDAKKSNKNQPILEIKLRIDELISPVVAINIE